MTDIDSELKKFGIYKELTLEILADTPDDELDMVITSYIRMKFENARSDEMRLEIIKNMSPGFQMAWSTWQLWWGVAHGGLNEFFYNGSDEFTHMTLQSLWMIGATEYSELLERAIELHREEMRNPVMQELYSEQTLHGYSESYRMSSLKELDNTFMKLGPHLHELVVQYVRSNPYLFVGS